MKGNLTYLILFLYLVCTNLIMWVGILFKITVDRKLFTVTGYLTVTRSLFLFTSYPVHKLSSRQYCEFPCRWRPLLVYTSKITQLTASSVSLVWLCFCIFRKKTMSYKKAVLCYFTQEINFFFLNQDLLE